MCYNYLQTTVLYKFAHFLDVSFIVYIITRQVTVSRGRSYPAVLFARGYYLCKVYVCRAYKLPRSQTNKRRAYTFARCIFARLSFRLVTKNGRPRRVETISTRNNYLEEQFRNALGEWWTTHRHDTRSPHLADELLKFTRPLSTVVTYHGL